MHRRADLRVRVRLASAGRRRRRGAGGVLAAAGATQLVQQQRVEPSRCGVVRLVLQDQPAVL